MRTGTLEIASDKLHKETTQLEVSELLSILCHHRYGSVTQDRACTIKSLGFSVVQCLGNASISEQKLSLNINTECVCNIGPKLIFKLHCFA